MVALARFGFGESPVSSAKLNAVIDTLTGAANTPVSLTGVNDPINYGLAVRNQDTAGKGLVVYAADGSTVLLQVQNSGVRASAAGGAALSIVTTDDAQTLTNKTLNAPVIGTGGLTVTAGGVGIGTSAGPATYGLLVGGTLATTTASAAGISVLATFPSTSSASIWGVEAAPSTVAATFAAGILASFHAAQGTRGTGSSITTNAGLCVDPMTNGSTNNYGVFVSTQPSGGSGSNVGVQVGATIGTIQAGIVVNNGIVLANSGPSIGVASTVGVTGTINALGGGAAATLGTIGGSGPGSAGQFSWWRINDGTVAGWVPVWH
jgi:hypothetical protein